MDESKNQIMTVADLKERYPGLVRELMDLAVVEVGGWPPEKLRERLPELYNRIAAASG